MPPETVPGKAGARIPPGILVRSILAALATLAAAALLLFVPAGTLKFWQAWSYIGMFFLYFAIGMPYFIMVSPGLIQRRLKAGPGAEEDASQKVIMAIGLPLLPPLFLVPGLDRRFGWSAVPAWLSIAALLVCLVGMATAYYSTVYNEYAASTITVEENQPVISAGPYALVRHPLYTGIGTWFFVTPLALGSWWGMLPAVLVPALLIVRLLYEERSLRERLPGYPEYCQKVRWRLIPGIF